MSAYAVFAPKWIGEGGLIGMNTKQVFPAEQAAWQDGDPLQNVVTGTIYTPTGGAGAVVNTTAGPSLGTAPVPFNITTASYSVTQGVVTVTATANTAAPARTLFCVVTYNDGTQTNESLNSTAFIINVPPGLNAIVSVSATGEPTSDGDHFGLYVGFLPLTYYLQNIGMTANGSTATINYPLTNSAGANKSASSASSGIIGIADCDSDAYYAGILGATVGGSLNTGKRSLFGATQSFSPGWPNDNFQLPVTSLKTGLLEVSLKQAWYPSLASGLTACGFSFDTTSGYMMADTAATACAEIVEDAYGGGPNTAYAPNPGDTGARVRIKFNVTALA